MSAATPNIVDKRSCESCALCCKLLNVPSISKPRPQWCQHCNTEGSCRIYADRPAECADFYCAYLTTADVGEHWRPAKSHMVLTYEATANRIAIYLDDGHEDAWRKEPYFSEIKQWAVAAAQNGRQVIVWNGLNATVIFPDGEKNIGRLLDGQVLITFRRKGSSVPAFDAIVMEQDDPRLEHLKPGERVVLNSA